MLMNAHLNPSDAEAPLVAIDTAGGTLRILRDGCGTLSLDDRVIRFGREIGRYALRRIYLGTWGLAADGRIVRRMAAELERCARCRRADCLAPIPENRRLKAFDRDMPAKWCSIRCQRTEAARRYRKRHGL